MDTIKAADRVREIHVDLRVIVDHLSSCLLIVQHHELQRLRGSIEVAMAAALDAADCEEDPMVH